MTEERKKVHRKIGQHIHRLDDAWGNYKPREAKDWLTILSGRLGTVATVLIKEKDENDYSYDDNALDRALLGLAAVLFKWIELRQN